MLERTVASVCMTGVMLVFDLWRFNKLDNKEKWLYALLILLVAYHAIDFIYQMRWPKFYDVTGDLLAKPAKAITSWFQVPQ